MQFDTLLNTLENTWAPRVLSLLRIMAGLLLLQFGMAKHLGFPVFEYLNKVQPYSLPWVAGLLELVGGGVWSVDALLRKKPRAEAERARAA